MSAPPREIRRLAFQTLFQFDVSGAAEGDAAHEMVEQINQSADRPLSPRDVRRALELALGAYRDRREADALVSELAPTWPAHRQPAVDRAIMRLAIHEMTSGHVGPKIAVNEAVELAKRYSTERSPSFVNGVLDKVLKRVLAGAGAGGEATE